MLKPGDTIDIWVVERALGTGGMGSVYRCHNRSATRILAAVKVLDGGLKRYPEAEARFVREAEILFGLDHPNIVKVRNIRTETELPYLEMEFIAGESLEERLRRGPMGYAEALSVFRQLAEALEYLHRRGVRHRDVKPANVLVQGDGLVKLVDFGLAVETDHTRITQAGMAFGTVSYAPPEWITPEEMDPAKWDIYALGVVFFEMLTGSLAFPVAGQGTARQQAMQIIIGKQGHAPLDPGDDFHDDVRALIREMTASDPTLRTSHLAHVVRAARGLSPEVRRTTGRTLAPESPFEDTGPPSILTDSVPQRALARAPTVAHREAAPATLPLPARVSPAVLAAWSAGAFVVGVSVMAVVAAVGLVWVGAQWMAAETDPRDVWLTVAPSSVPVEVRLGGAAPVGREVGGALVFPRVPLGPAALAWAAGEGCSVDGCESGSCPAWCATGCHSVEIEAGRGSQAMVFAPELPAPRAVELALPALDAATLVEATLGDRVGARSSAGALVFDGVLPGPYALSAKVVGCDEPVCQLLADVVVPVTGPPVPAELTLSGRPATAVPPAPVPVASPVPEAPPTAPAGSGHLVTWADIAASSEDAAQAWLSTSSLAGKDGSAAAIDVPAKVYRAVCRERGGLATVEQPPQEKQSPEFDFELRRRDRVPVWLDLTKSPPEQLPMGSLDDHFSIAAGRCAR